MLAHLSLSPRAYEAPAVLAGLWFFSAEYNVRIQHYHHMQSCFFHIAALGTDPVAVCVLAAEKEESSICLREGPWVWHSLRNPSNTVTHVSMLRNTNIFNPVCGVRIL